MYNVLKEVNMIAVDILKTDIKHCRLDEAKKLFEYFAEDFEKYIHEDEFLNNEFREMSLDYEPNILTAAEYIWRNYWDEFIDYMRKKHLD